MGGPGVTARGGGGHVRWGWLHLSRAQAPTAPALRWRSPRAIQGQTHHGSRNTEAGERLIYIPEAFSFRDVHLQSLLGFGLLVAFLSRYGPGSVAISILVVAFAIQWAVLIQGFLYFFLNGKIYVGAQSADFCAAAILIATGALVGRVNPVQMLLLTLLGVTLFTLNEYVLLSLMGVRDSGGSLTVHTFGAYFGLMVSRILHEPHMEKRKEQQDTGHQPDFFAVVGTIFLWIFWPSFTSATTARDAAEPWAVLNTYFSLAASTLATFVANSPDHVLLHQVQLQDATLASVAMMGMAGEMLVTPFGALIAGFLAGLIPPLGFRFFTPVLRSRLKIQDTCGVQNVHGLPGILGSLLGTLLAALATADAYGAASCAKLEPLQAWPHVGPDSWAQRFWGLLGAPGPLQGEEVLQRYGCSLWE
uniref:Rh family B glycoprotein (gene/pseudogene) n=1 Tax=Athene cunicularia TaxID=194338 RepID=A0A663M574_ATHCN